MDSRTVQLICDAGEAAPGKTAAVLYIGGVVQTEPWMDKVSAVLCLWYPGQNGTLAHWDAPAADWVIPAGRHTLWIGPDAAATPLAAKVTRRAVPPSK